MRISRFTFVVTSLMSALVLFSTVTPAYALFGSSARKTLKKADDAMVVGRRAEAEGRVMDACDAYSLAHQLYYKLSTEDPGLETNHVSSQDSECLQRLRTLFARASSASSGANSSDEHLMPLVTSGTSKPAGSSDAVAKSPTMPKKPVANQVRYVRPTDASRSAVYEEDIPLSPAEPVTGLATTTRPASNFERVAPAPEKPSFSPPSVVPTKSTSFVQPEEDLFASDEPKPIGNRPFAWREARTKASMKDEKPAATTQVAAPSVAKVSVIPSKAIASTSAASENAVVDEFGQAIPEPTYVYTPPSARKVDSRVKVPAVVSATPVASGASTSSQQVQTMTERISRLISEGKASNALMLMEKTIEDKGVETTMEDRLLFAQTLVNCGNYDRAEKVLDAVLDNDPYNVSALTMMSGVKFVQGYPVAALKHMNSIVSKHPRYADVYVNIAYTRFAMDPGANRNEAINCYKVALQLGAERDPNLEMELNIGVIR